jgi:hypothetical protein
MFLLAIARDFVQFDLQTTVPEGSSGAESGNLRKEAMRASGLECVQQGASVGCAVPS